MGLRGDATEAEGPVTELRGRALMESRYGPLGCGAQLLTVGGVEYTLAELLYHMGLNFEDARGIDLLTVSFEHYVVRYYDGQTSASSRTSSMPDFIFWAKHAHTSPNGSVRMLSIPCSLGIGCSLGNSRVW
jgi:hypothetical protein